MAAVSKITRNYTASLFTGFGIILFVLYYIFAYIPAKEEKINARYYRVLQRISENLNTKVEHYRTHVATNYIGEIEKKYRKTLTVPTTDSEKQLLVSEEFRKWVRQQVVNQQIKAFSTGLNLSLRCQDSLLHISDGDKSLHIPVSYQVVREDTVKTVTFNTAISLDSILTPLMRRDSFNSFIVLRKQNVREGKNEKNRIIYLTKEDTKNRSVNLVPLDTLVNLAGKSGWQEPTTLSIAGVPHKLFVLTQQVGPYEEWALYGAVLASKYDAERKALPSHVLTFASLTFAILFLAFPFLKLTLMSRQERLYKWDIAVSVVSLFFGIALVVIFLLDGYAYYGPDKNAELKRLEILNSTLSSNMVHELKGLVNQLKRYDKSNDTASYTSIKEHRPDQNKLPTVVKWTPQPPRQNYVLMGTQIDSETKNKETTIGAYYTAPDAFKHFLRVFWVDSSGHMSRVWTAKPTVNKSEGVGKRDYFNKIKDGVGWSLKGETDTFYLQSISSQTYGGKYAVISLKSKRETKPAKRKDVVIALTTKLASLYNPILPPEYGFCVVNEKGEVLFHQSENLNLGENLLEETDQDPALETALSSRIPVHIEQDYQGVRQMMYIAPIDHLPLYLVTYVNQTSMRASNLYIILQTLVFFLFYCAILSLLISLVVYGKRRFTKLSFSWLAFRWLWPQPDKAAIYLKNQLFICATLLAAIAFTVVDNPVEVFFILIYAATYVFIFCYISLHAVPLLHFFSKKNSYYASRLRIFVSSSVFIVVALNGLCYFIDLVTFYKGITFQLTVLLGYTAIHTLFYATLVPKEKGHTFLAAKKFSKWLTRRYQPCYVLMIMFWLLLTSALAAYFMFQVSYNLEGARRVMYTQLHLANRLNATSSKEYQLIRTDTSSIKPYHREVARKMIYTQLYHPEKQKIVPASLFQLINDSAPPLNFYSPEARSYCYTTFFQKTVYQKEVHRNSETNWRKTPNNFSDSQAEQIFTTAHTTTASSANGPQSSSIGSLSFWLINPTKYIFSFAPDYQEDTYTEGMWSPLTAPVLQFRPPRLVDGDSLITLSSTLPKFMFPPLFYNGSVSIDSFNKSGALYWIDMLILAFVLFNFLGFIVNRVFNLQLLKNIHMRRMNRSLLHPKHRNRLFVISLPGATCIRSNLKELAKKQKLPLQVLEYDMAAKESVSDFQSEILKRQNRKSLAVYLKNFDHLPFTEESVKMKVDVLRTLSELQEVKIIIESAMHPSCWEEKLKDESVQVGNLKDLMQQLLFLLGDFAKVYNTVKVGTKVPAPPKLYELNEEELLILFVQEECQSLEILKQFEDVLCDYVRKKFQHGKKVEKEDIIYRLQSLAQIHYRRLWSTCSEEEKYFLYDLAQDGLVNARNIGVLSSLLGKGLLEHRKGRLSILNESFKSFVLTVVNPMEALRFEQKVAKTSSWHTYRTPFLLIIIGVALFIFYTQKQAWLNTVAVVTAVSTILTLLPRLSVLLPTFLLSKETK